MSVGDSFLSPSCAGLRIGSFSSKTRTSLKTQLLFYVLEHSNFPAFSLPESCSQTVKFPKNSLHSRISIICKCAHIAFGFPSRRLILQGCLQKRTFQVVSFRMERTISLSTIARVLKLIHFVIYFLEQKTYAGVFLTRIFLLKQPDMGWRKAFLAMMA